MTLNEQYNKWKVTTLKKSLDKFSERRTRFETSAGIEVPRVALPVDFDTGRADPAPTPPPFGDGENLSISPRPAGERGRGLTRRGFFPSSSRLHG